MRTASGGFRFLNLPILLILPTAQLFVKQYLNAVNAKALANTKLLFYNIFFFCYNNIKLNFKEYPRKINDKNGADTMANVLDPMNIIIHFVNIGLIILGFAALILIIITCAKVIRYLNKKEKQNRTP